MSAEQIIASWKKNTFKPIYWLEGEESYFIDQVVQYAEHHILSESEASFNMSIYYGKDVEWQNLVNDCRSYPMFAERRLVILKEAQQMRDINKLEGYMENPMPSTILIVSYKEKKLDARTKMSKTIKKYGELLQTKKMYDNQLPTWINQLVKEKGYTITPKATTLIVESIGNNISRISNEINKLAVNLTNRNNITEDDVENYIGISKEFNVFELQNALSYRDLPKAIKIVEYFASNPKANPIMMILPSLYNHFAKIYSVIGAGSQDSRVISEVTGVNPYFVRDFIAAAQNYGFAGVEKAIIVIQQFNLRAIGIDNATTSDGSLLKECILKIMM